MADDIRAGGGAATVVPTDITDTDAVKRLFAHCVEERAVGRMQSFGGGGVRPSGT